MKKIILYCNKAQIKINHNILDNPYYSAIYANTISTKDLENIDFVLIDTDTYKNYCEIIEQYKEIKAKFWACTDDTSKENILKLYNAGFDNVIKQSENIDKILGIMTNHENQTISIQEKNQLLKSKKILIVDEKNSNINNLIEILANLNCLYTYRSATDEATKEFYKDNYDLIIINNLQYNQCLNILTNINSSPNTKTPVVIITQDKKFTELTTKIDTLSFLNPNFKNEFAQIQISNLLKIKELEDKQLKSNELLENIILHSNKQLILTTPDFLVLYSGNQCFTIKKGEYIFGFLNNINIKYPQDEILNYINNNQKVLNFNFQHDDKCYEINISKIYTKNGDLQNYLIVIDDLTIKYLMEEQKETFIATLTHDLKSPIRAEQSVLKQMLEEKFGKLNKNQTEIISEMLNSREYMKRMIDNILTRYKCTSQKLELSLSLNNLKETIEASINDIAYIIKEKKQNLTIEYNAKTEEFLYDKIEIKRVLTNIIANAAEYTPSNGQIKILTEQNTDNIIIQISDNGYGIDKNDLIKIFDKNVTYAKKYRKVGSGLGLYIAKTIIDAHNGTISAESELNKGSTFTIYLPIKNTPAKKETMLKECYQN